MGVTLDELLDESGISSMNVEHEKTASEDTHDGLDLVEQLRKFAEDDTVSLKEDAERELIEKTAEILVIKETIGEINNLSSIGIDSGEQAKIASFISSALESGHSEEEIAFFLEKRAGIIGQVGRGFERMIQRNRRRSIPRFQAVADRAKSRGNAVIEKEKSLLRKSFLRGNDKEIARHIDDVEAHYGPEGLQDLLIEMKNEGTRLPHNAYRRIPKNKAIPSYSVKINDTTHQISKQRAHQAGLAGLGLGTGYAVSNKGRGNSNGSSRNVTIVS